MSGPAYIFSRFERIWHWAQAALVIVLGATGFEIHGFYRWLGFDSAVSVHVQAAWLLIGLWVFAIFWHLTTGEWRQYIPTTENLAALLRYYLTGIFRADPHPFRQTRLQKHNPLQRLAYLGVKLVINPLAWVTGMLMLFYGQWAEWGLTGLVFHAVALGHTGAAYLMLSFLIVHMYFITTGETVLAHTRAMITGYERAGAVPGAREQR